MWRAIVGGVSCLTKVEVVHFYQNGPACYRLVFRSVKASSLSRRGFQRPSWEHFLCRGWCRPVGSRNDVWSHAAVSCLKWWWVMQKGLWVVYYQISMQEEPVWHVKVKQSVLCSQSILFIVGSCWKMYSCESECVAICVCVCIWSIILYTAVCCTKVCLISPSAVFYFRARVVGWFCLHKIMIKWVHSTYTGKSGTGTPIIICHTK